MFGTTAIRVLTGMKNELMSPEMARPEQVQPVSRQEFGDEMNLRETTEISRLQPMSLLPNSAQAAKSQIFRNDVSVP